MRISKLPALCAQQLVQHEVRTLPRPKRAVHATGGLPLAPELMCRWIHSPLCCSQARADGAVKTAAIGLSDDVKQLAADVAGQIKCYTEAIAGLERQVRVLPPLRVGGQK